MAFWNYIAKKSVAHDADAARERSVRSITCDEIFPIDDEAEARGLSESPIELLVYVTKKFEGKNLIIPQEMCLTRTNDEIIRLKKEFRNSPTDHWLDFSDTLKRNQYPFEPSFFRTIDAQVYDGKDRAETGDWFFRRELHLSHATYDKLWEVLMARFPTRSPSRSACAVLAIDGITKNAIRCDRPYSGSVTRKAFDIESFRLQSCPCSKETRPPTLLFEHVETN